MPAQNLSVFSHTGGKFLIPEAELKAQVSNLKAFIFDWDGVFNNGVKSDEGGSPFSEIDSMGLNMLRFGYFLKYNFIPEIYIITGENNPSALHLSKREHFKAVYLNAKVKTAALDHLLISSNLQQAEIAFMFDDILDLGLAAQSGTGFYVERAANPLLNDYVKRHSLAAYQTANPGGQNPVREVCELCLACLGNFAEVVTLRVANDEKYQEYLVERNYSKTVFYQNRRGDFQEFQHS